MFFRMITNCRKLAKIGKTAVKNRRKIEKKSQEGNIRKVEQVVERLRKTQKVETIAEKLRKSQKDREKTSGSFRYIRKVEKVVERLRKTQNVEKIAKRLRKLQKNV